MSTSAAAAVVDDVLFAVGFEGEMDRRQITLHLAIRRRRTSRGGSRGEGRDGSIDSRVMRCGLMGKRAQRARAPAGVVRG